MTSSSKRSARRQPVSQRRAVENIDRLLAEHFPSNTESYFKMTQAELAQLAQRQEQQLAHAGSRVQHRLF